MMSPEMSFMSLLMGSVLKKNYPKVFPAYLVEDLKDIIKKVSKRSSVSRKSILKSFEVDLKPTLCQIDCIHCNHTVTIDNVEYPWGCRVVSQGRCYKNCEHYKSKNDNIH